MAFFSRLTDIVTCNLTRLLSESDNPEATLREIIAEIEAGMAGARRSMQTAQRNEERLRGEVEEHRRSVTHWAAQARQALQSGQEDQARLALVRKREADDLVSGLQDELRAASETREHLDRTYRALEARLSEARRRQQSGCSAAEAADDSTVDDVDPSIASEIEDELAALKRELGQQ